MQVQPGGEGDPQEEDGKEETPRGTSRSSAAASGAVDQLARLYVASIPKTMTESQLKPLFDQWGTVRDITILRERATGASRGCAFVGFANSEEADAAVQHLNHRVQLPGALGPLEVRFARGRRFVPAGSGPEDNRQLFFSRAPLSTTEGELHALFSRFGGSVESVNLFRDQEARTSKGCGLVTMATRQEAIRAMEAMDEKIVLEGGAAPLSVKWADMDLRARRNSKAPAGEASAAANDEADGRTVFFARVLRSADEGSVRDLFLAFGRVVDVNLFRVFQGAPTTKGCGLVTMGSAEEAAAAIEGLHERHTWPGMAQPMVVRWMDSALQRRRREEYLTMKQQAGGPGAACTGPQPTWNPAAAAGGGPFPGAPLAPAGAGAPHPPGGSAPGGNGPLSGMAPPRGAGGPDRLHQGTSSEAPPPGCSQDAYKLFIGNVPAGYDEQDLRRVLEGIGPVADVVVLRDKQTGLGKGSAFVWFASRADADRATLELHERRALPDPSGAQPRALVVQRARGQARKQAGQQAGQQRRQQQQPLAQQQAPLLHVQPPAGRQAGWGLGGGAAAAAGPPTPVHVRMQQAGGVVRQVPMLGADATSRLGPSAMGVGGGVMYPLVIQQMTQAPGNPGMVQVAAGGGGGAFAAATGLEMQQGGPVTYVSAPGPQDLQGGGPGSYLVAAPSRPDSGSYALLSSGSLAVSGSGGHLHLVAGGGGDAGGGPLLASWNQQAAPQGQQPQQMQYIPYGQAQLLGSAQQAAGGHQSLVAGLPAAGATIQMHLVTRQVDAVSPHIAGIQNASGAEASMCAISPGLFCLQLSGSKPAVDAAAQIVVSILQNIA